MEILRSDDNLLEKFGQVYLTTAYPNVIKAWHYHKQQDDNFCVVKGMAKVALYDGREGSPTKGNVMDFFIGEHNPCLIHIPVGVWHGYKGIGVEPTLLLNAVTLAYDYDNPDEFRIPYNVDTYQGSPVDYDWNKDINA